MTAPPSLPGADTAIDPAHFVRSVQQLEAHYGGRFSETSSAKEVEYLHPLYQAFIKASPFVLIATRGTARLDISPRGDPPGFVEVRDSKTLLIPDRTGNNRLDTLRNLLHDRNVGLLFLVPGVRHTLRVSGTADLSVDPALAARFAMQGKPAKGVMVVQVSKVFYQCPKASIRSRLWQPDAQIPESSLPTIGQTLAALTDDRIDAAHVDTITLPEALRHALY